MRRLISMKADKKDDAARPSAQSAVIALLIASAVAIAGYGYYSAADNHGTSSPGNEDAAHLNAPSSTESAEHHGKLHNSIERLEALAHSAGAHPRSWVSPDFWQEFTGVNFNSLRVTDHAKDLSGIWQSVNFHRSANYGVRDVASLGYDQFALLGFTRADTLRVERWDLTPVDAPVIINGPGGPAPTGVLTGKKFSTKESFEGFQGHTPIAIEADPAGRFFILLLQDATQSFLAIRLAPPAAPGGTWQVNELANSTTSPFLDQPTALGKFDHPTLGRVYRIDSIGSSGIGCVLLIDSDNDGQLEGLFEGSLSDLSTSNLDKYEDWMPLHF